MALYSPTKEWTEDSIEVPEYGIIQKYECMHLAGIVETFLLQKGLVFRIEKLEEPTSEPETQLEIATPPPDRKKKIASRTENE